MSAQPPATVAKAACGSSCGPSAFASSALGEPCARAVCEAAASPMSADGLSEAGGKGVAEVSAGGMASGAASRALSADAPKEPVAPDAASGARSSCVSGSVPVRGALAARRLDPRVSVAILVLLNAIAFSPNTMGAHFAMVGLCAVVCVWCGRAASAARWCAVYVAVTAVGYLSLLAPSSAAASFAVILVVVRCVFCIGMFASNMIATTRVGELACALQRVHLLLRCLGIVQHCLSRIERFCKCLPCIFDVACLLQIFILVIKCFQAALVRFICLRLKLQLHGMALSHGTRYIYTDLNLR